MFGWWKKRRSKKRTLKVHLSEEEYQLLLSVASRNGKSPVQWAQEMVMGSISLGARKKLSLESRARAVMGVAYQHLDLQDSLHPTEALQLAEEPEAPKRIRTGNTEHPCHFLDKVVDPMWTGQCSGICAHSSQEGRICHWTPERATECDLYEAKRFGKQA